MLSRTLVAVVVAILAVAVSPVLSTSHYSTFFNQTFPWKATAPIANAIVSLPSSTTVGLSASLLQQSPFTSVYGVNVTVDAVANLAFPFTGASGTYQDVDTGIDVVAGGQVTFYVPIGYTGGNWCFELGRAGAGYQFCSGPPGAWYSGTASASTPNYVYNAKINGAYISSDPAVPQWTEVINPSLGYTPFANSLPSGASWNLTQYGANRGFTWTRSGSVVFRIGAQPGSGSSSVSSYSFNDPTTDYDSAFDSTAEGLHPAPTVDPTTGLVGRTIVTPVSGRLWLACWRWNLWPGLNGGQVWTLINYTSPVQVAQTWSPSSASLGNTQPAINVQQPIPAVLTVPDTFPAGIPTTAVQGTLKAVLPVENITVSNFLPSAASFVPLIQTSFSYHYPNVRPVPAVQNGPAVACCYGGTSVNWLGNGAVQQFDGLFGTIVSYNGALAWDMTHILDANSTSPFFSSGGTFTVKPQQNPWYPQSQLGSYFGDVDTGLNVLEGGIITITAPVQQWCFATYYNNATSLCSDARGVPSFWFYNTIQTYLIGCDRFDWIFQNGSAYNQSTYDNHGCNSGSIVEPPNGALLIRVGSNNQGHSPIDYATAFSDRTQTGTLTATIRAPASGRLYFAAAVMVDGNVLSSNQLTGIVTQSTTYGTPYSGSQVVTVTYTPPAEISFGFQWNPAQSTASQPYAVSLPTSLSATALSNAGFTLVSASSSSATGLGAGVVTGSYIYYVLPETLQQTSVYTSTFYAYIDLAEADTAPASTTFSTGGASPTGESVTSSAAAPGTSTGGGSPSKGAASTVSLSAAGPALLLAVIAALLL